ncbi:MAG: CrcB protein [Cyclobacteriaceae bacterium]|jgi:CrcB protein
MIRLALIVGLGGFLGSSARFLVQQFFVRFIPSIGVAGTFAANILGCLIIGIFIAQSGKMQREWMLFLTSGFCGGFTTFSAFAFENTNFIINDQNGQAALYIGLSIMMGLLATYIGMLIGKSII